MDFPDFGDNQDIQINDDLNNDNTYNYNQTNTYEFNNNNSIPVYNVNDIPSYNNLNTNNEWTSPMDPEEEKRIEARRAEEDERRKILNEKIRQELDDKQEKRKEGVEWLQRWEDQRHNNISKKKQFNKANEEEYLKNRNQSKETTNNPWDKVIDNIQLKESEHKGVKDISRMKSVILQRKSDFVNMKMK